MPSEIAATSPAASTNGDARKSTAANVSQADVIAHFIKRDSERSEAPQTTDTKAPEAPEAPAESSPESPSVAEPAPADSPEAESPESTETPEGAKEGAEEEADDVLSPESQTLDQKAKDIIKKIQDKTKKRFNAERAKRGDVERLLAQERKEKELLTGQLQQSQQAQQNATPPVAPIANAPLPDIKDLNSLTEYRKQAKQTVRWAEEVLDRDDIDQGVQVGEKVLTKAEVKAIKRNAQEALEDKIPAQQEYFQQQGQLAHRTQQVWQAAVQKFPFLAEKDNPEVNQTVAYLRSSNPSILASPNAAWDVGLMIMGARALAAQQSKGDDKVKPPTPLVKPKPKAPSDQTVVSTTATSPRSSDAAKPALRQPTGNQTAQSTAQYLAQMENARMAANR